MCLKYNWFAMRLPRFVSKNLLHPGFCTSFQWISSLILIGMLATACSPANTEQIQTANIGGTSSPLPTIQPTALSIEPTTNPTPSTVWLSTGTPESLKQALPDLPLSESPQPGEWKLEVAAEHEGDITWLYALVTAFPNRVDALPLETVQAAWKGKAMEEMNGQPIWLSSETLAAFSALWGEPAAGTVQVAKADQLLEATWQQPYGWALVPFEDLQPRWKVVRLGGLTLLDRNLDFASYPLVVHFSWTGGSGELPAKLPASNRDEEKLTTLLLTGTTALVRHTAQRMEQEGVNYPAEDIGDLLGSADITHISNEVPFYSLCPPADPVRKEMRFCSDPGYVELLKTVGADVIELTGNHELDWGADAFRETLAIYEQEGFLVYGGGADLVSAQRPLVLEDHGNRIGLIGCNAAGPDAVFATTQQPGAAPCDLDYIAQVIRDWRAQGIIPIVTFQHYEVDDYKPASAQRVDFLRIADAGAAIVSGSQSHFPQGMIFQGDTFVHYGLGNLFFDQMDTYHRRAFIDRHFIYDGQYISTELIPTMLEDYSRPRLMISEERVPFLETIFTASGW